MNRNLATAIRDALNLERPVDRVEATKLAVSEHLSAFDRTATIRHTEYFNHTFAPDMVMSWKRGRRERLVYLRPTSDPAWIADDLRAFGHTRPIVLTLDERQSTSGRDSASRQLRNDARQTRTLVTEPAAIDAIGRRREPISDLFGHAVVKAGRGVFNKREAQRASTTTVAGFAAAQHLDFQPTRAATKLITSVLDDEHAGRVNRVLRAVWEAHGGVSVDFPAQDGSRGDLDEDDLTLLLNAVETDDLAFWRRVGQNVSLEQLTALRITDPRPNLTHLVTANLDRLAARSVRVLNESADLFELFEQDVTLHWIIARGCLVLRSPMWRAYFAITNDNLPEPAQAFHGASAERILTFARESGIRTTDLKVRRTDIAITFEALAESANVAESEDVVSLTTRKDSIAHVATLAVRGRSLVVDLLSGTAGGHTNATFTLLDFGRAALPLLLRDQDGYQEDLDQVFGAHVQFQDGDQLTLDDLLEVPPQDRRRSAAPQWR